MCRSHWAGLPLNLRHAVLAAYSPGQERLDGTAPVTDAYLRAARQAVEYLEVVEGIG